MTKLLGRYSQQQGMFVKARGRLTNFSSEAWCFLQLQFCGVFPAETEPCGTSMRVRIHRVTESGLVVKAARISRSCSVMRFETKAQLRQLCRVFGESATAGQRCRLPKITAPKMLGTNDVVNVVRGADTAEPFSSRTVRDGVDLEFDGSSELFLTIRYSRFAYSPTNLEGCDPLLYSLIRRCDPYACDRVLEVGTREDDTTIMYGSEFEDFDGRLYRVTGMDAMHVFASCCYPQCNNELLGCEKSFDMPLAKELIQQRLNG
jgi:hypothetical protein